MVDLIQVKGILSFQNLIKFLISHSTLPFWHFNTHKKLNIA